MNQITILHSANTTPAQMSRLVGDTQGIPAVFPQAKAIVRWDHLGDTDVPNLMTVGGDYIAGFSSGAFMAMRMLRERQYKAACIVAGGLLESYLHTPWRFPCPVLLINGTADKNVPYDGVEYAYEAGLGAAVELRKMLGCEPTPARENISDDSSDKCRAYIEIWGKPPAKVRLYTVVNGGHTWPGSTHNLSPAIAGPTCMDFSATAVMLEFFRRFP